MPPQRLRSIPVPAAIGGPGAADQRLVSRRRRSSTDPAALGPDGRQPSRRQAPQPHQHGRLFPLQVLVHQLVAVTLYDYHQRDLDTLPGRRGARQHPLHGDREGKLATSSSTSRPWPMVRDTGTIPRSGGDLGQEIVGVKRVASPSPPIITGTWWTRGYTAMVARPYRRCARSIPRADGRSTRRNCCSAAVKASGLRQERPLLAGVACVLV